MTWAVAHGARMVGPMAQSTRDRAGLGSGRTAAAIARSYLYAPAHRARVLGKALGGATGAQAVIVDLEDGVPEDKRGEAEENLAAATRDHADGPAVLCRVRPGRRERAADLGLVPPWFDGVLLAKAERAEDVQQAAEALDDGDLQLWLLIESARGVEQLPMLLGLGVPVAGVMFGAGDMRADLALPDEDDDRLLDHVRSRIVVSCVAAGVTQIVDTPDGEIEPTQRAVDRVRSARGLGFTAKAAIHPAQLEAIHDAYRPSAERVAWARGVLDAGGGAQRLDGQMVDEATKRLARQVLADGSSRDED